MAKQLNVTLTFRDDVAEAPIHKLLIGWGNGGWRFLRRDDIGNWRSMIGRIKEPPQLWAECPSLASEAR